MEHKRCQICDKPRAKYSCPKCSIAYCSLACYRDKRHEGCTESFYKDQVEEEMRAREADEEMKKAMYNLIKRYQDQMVDEEGDSGNDIEETEEEEGDIVDRMQGLDLDNVEADAIWDRLTESERKDFLEQLNGHELNTLIQPWKPWWAADKIARIVELNGSAGASKTDQDAQQSQIPALSSINVPVQKLTNKVHPSVLNQLAQVSLAYVYMMRHLNGDPRGENLVSAFKDLTLVSPLLSSKVADIYSSAQESLIIGLLNIDEGITYEAKCTLLDDIYQIYTTQGHACAMISDLYGIFKSALSESHSSNVPLKKAHVQRAERRVYFLLCVVLQMSQSTEPWQFMATDIAILRRRFESEHALMSKETSKSTKIVATDSIGL